MILCATQKYIRHVPHSPRSYHGRWECLLNFPNWIPWTYTKKSLSSGFLKDTHFWNSLSHLSWNYTLFLFSSSFPQNISIPLPSYDVHSSFLSNCTPSRLSRMSLWRKEQLSWGYAPMSGVWSSSCIDHAYSDHLWDMTIQERGTLSFTSQCLP